MEIRLSINLLPCVKVRFLLNLKLEHGDGPVLPPCLPSTGFFEFLTRCRHWGATSNQQYRHPELPARNHQSSRLLALGMYDKVPYFV